jgi:hypothetical protein
MKVMPNMLTDLKNNKHGCPIQFVKTDDNQEDFEKGMKEWHAVLDRMIFCFREMNDDTCSLKNEYDDEYRRQLNKPNEGKPFKDWFVKNEDRETYSLIQGEVDPELAENHRNKIIEIEAYKEKMKDEGLALFSKYFWNLWD